MATPARTIVYVDGFNLYYGIRQAELDHLRWLNIRELARRLVGAHGILQRTKYFTARIAGAHPGDSLERAAEREAKRRRQALYLEAVATLRNVDVCEGKYLLKHFKCDHCRAKSIRPEEKMTDVRIATELLTDAFHDRFDSAIVVSGDGDLAPPITAVRADFPQKAVLVAFPPRRYSLELVQVAERTIDIYESVLEKCQLPEEIELRSGYVIRRPSEWQ